MAPITQSLCLLFTLLNPRPLRKITRQRTKRTSWQNSFDEKNRHIIDSHGVHFISVLCSKRMKLHYLLFLFMGFVYSESDILSLTTTSADNEVQDRFF